MRYEFRVGDLDCTVLSDGQPTGALEPPLEMFFTAAAGVHGPDLAAAVAAEGAGRSAITCGYNCLLVRTVDGLALLDTGLGASFLGYGPVMQPHVGLLGVELAAAGVQPADLAGVVFTHLHQDHSRGAVWPGEPYFPAALGFAHAAEIAYWSAADRSAADPHLAAARDAIELFGARLRSFEYDAEILPGLRAVAAPGHTPGHTAVLLASRGERLLCTGDTFYDPLQLRHPDWRTPWDCDGPASVASRKALLRLAAAEDLLVHAYHLPFPGLGRVRPRGDAYEWRPVA